MNIQQIPIGTHYTHKSKLQDSGHDMQCSISVQPLVCTLILIRLCVCSNERLYVFALFFSFQFFSPFLLQSLKP